MNSIQKDIRNTDGTIETILITSNDNYQTLDINKTYKLVNIPQNKENKLASAFKNSIFGAEIGIKAEGFSTIALLATVVAAGGICLTYILCRI